MYIHRNRFRVDCWLRAVLVLRQRLEKLAFGLGVAVSRWSRPALASPQTRLSHLNRFSVRILLQRLVFPVLTITGLLFTIDSPVFQVKRGQTDQARRSLYKLYGAGSPDVPARLANIQRAIALERETHARLAAARWSDLFRDPVDRRRTMIACIIWIIYQSGGNAFTANGLYFLSQLGINIDIVFKITISMLALSSITNLFAGYALERFGRRACFVYANIVHLIVLIVIGGLGFVSYQSAGGWVSPDPAQ